MKKLYLVANAHLDPIWQWEYQEGVASAISTFQSAVNLSKEFDYVFCHNESFLFEEIEQNAPSLFKQIKKLVKKGKWVVMGNWYLQPDLNLPCGESIVRQILIGKDYFKRKFGVSSDTACSFDAFGHSRGVVQIINKCGQKNYLHVRPFFNQLELKDNYYYWKGFDGSMLKSARVDVYATLLGAVKNKITEYIDKESNRDIGIKLWGVGNHGGGPSRKDLSDIKDLQKSSDVEIIHGSPDEFFLDMKSDFVFDKSLRPSMPGCYVSMSRLKREHIACENMLFKTEKICSIANRLGYPYPSKSILDASKSIMLSEFHDVLAGTCVKSGETQILRHLGNAYTLLETEFKKAFFFLTENQNVAKSGEYPIFVFNPNPFEYETLIECEFCLDAQNESDLVPIFKVYDENNRLLSSQKQKEESNLNIDWRIKIAFVGKLKPLAVTRFSVFSEFVEKSVKSISVPKNIVFDNGLKNVVINSESGALSHYSVNGKVLIDGDAFVPFLYDDNADSWAMNAEQLISLGTNPVKIPFTNTPSGIFEKAKSVSIIEDGDLFFTVQSVFEQSDVKVRVLYTVYKFGVDVDVKVDVFFNQKDKILKLHVPTTFSNENAFGQTLYGTELLENDGREVVYQRFVSFGNDTTKLAIINNSTFSGSFNNGLFAISLLRGAGYCVHPMLDRPFFSDFQYVQRLDQGESNYSFKLTYADSSSLERVATNFVQQPYAMNLFPIGCVRKDKRPCNFLLDNENVVLSCFKKAESFHGYVIRLFNNSDNSTSANINVFGKSLPLSFGAFEIKTLKFARNKLVELNEIII